MDNREPERNLNKEIGRRGGGQCGFLVAMFKGNLIALAFGLALSFEALAQEVAPPSLEREPVAEPRQEQRAPTREDHTQDQQQPAGDIATFLQGIESAIRDLIAEEDKIEREGQEHRDIRDLQAQEEMALWAKRMTWASVGGLLLTFAGLVLIGFTLHHTRRAADYAMKMVGEAEKTTAAAEAAVIETRRIGEAQTRAYVRVNLVSLESVPEEPLLIIGNVQNTGNSPARNFDCKATGFILAGSEKRRLHMEIGRHGNWPSDIAAQELRTIKFACDNVSLGPNLSSRAFITVDFGYSDVFGRRRVRTMIFEGVARPFAHGRIEFHLEHSPDSETGLDLTGDEREA